jgi:hypothetical protein
MECLIALRLVSAGRAQALGQFGQWDRLASRRSDERTGSWDFRGPVFSPGPDTTGLDPVGLGPGPATLASADRSLVWLK